MRISFSLIVAVSLFVGAPAAEAQWRSERPYRGLFAGGVGDTEQSLTATASLGAGWDDNLIAEAAGRGPGIRPSDVGREFQGGLGTGSAALSYSLSRGAVGLGASAGTTLRYYPSLANDFIRREYASAGASAALGGGFSASASAAYQPYSLRSMMTPLSDPRLGDPAIIDEDFPASREHYISYSGGVGYGRSFTPRQSFSASYNYRASERSGSGDTDRFAMHGAGADYRYIISRDLSVQLGYGYSQALYRTDDIPFGSHTINANVQYNRALSFSRRTTLSFGTGSSALRRSRGEAFRFRATGSARLAHEIGRTWSATLAYNRGVQFIESWPEPVFSDSAVAGFGGLLNSRMQFQLTARALLGNGYSGGGGDDSRLQTYNANASLSFGITRHINSGLTYSFYRHEFGDQLLVAPGLPNHLERRSVRAFVSVWVPLYQRARP